MPEPTSPLTCIDCGASITPRSRNGRCRACHGRWASQHRRSGGFTPETSRDANATRAARRAETERLAALARAAGLA